MPAKSETISDEDIEKKKRAIERFFSSFAEQAASKAGAPLAFVLALSFLVAGLIAGPIVGFASWWQTLITGMPSVVTFLLVFLIQNSQNRETRAVQLKLNELLRATKGAHTAMVSLEKLTESELRIIAAEYELLAGEARKKLSRGLNDKDVLEISLPEEAKKIP